MIEATTIILPHAVPPAMAPTINRNLALAAKLSGHAPPPQPMAERHALLDDLVPAMRDPSQLTLAYQPRVDLATGRCCAVEALLRWEHPQHGPLSPGSFIPLIEGDKLMGALTDWVLDTSMRFARRLQDLGQPIRVSANVSPTNLVFGYLAGRLVELLGTHGIDPAMLELEFTEGALIGDDNRTRQQLKQIRRTGILVAIDDFGAGYSNLGYFRQIAADVIKIDRSLVADIVTDTTSATVVKWVIGLGHELGLRIVAEGIETGEMQRLLEGWGADEGQGWHLGRPMTETAIVKWLSER